MQFEELLKLIDRLETSSVSYVDYTHAGDHVILSKDGLMTSPTSNVIAQADGSTNIQVRETTSQQTSVGSTNSAETTEVNNEAVAQGETVLSPMVGVAYL